MRAVARGDDQAFTRLVDRYLDALYRYALRLSRSSTWAEDLVQETWLKAWSHANRYRARQGKVSTWLFRILHNQHIDTLRKKTPELDEDAVENQASSIDLDRELHADERASQLTGALGALSEEHRAALLLHYFQGFSHAQVADILGISRRAGESLVARAKRNLEQHIHAQN